MAEPRIAITMARVVQAAIVFRRFRAHRVLAGGRARSPWHPRGVVWLLIVALLGGAHATAVLRVSGPAHWHGPAATEPPLAARLLARWNAMPQLFQHAHGHVHDHVHHSGQNFIDHGVTLQVAVETPAHAHLGLQRHGHALGDTDVHPVPAADGVEDLGSQSTSGAAALTWASGAAAATWAPLDGQGSWPQAVPPRWRSADAQLAWRPPAA